MDWKEHAHLFANGRFKYRVMVRKPVTLTPRQFPKKEWFTNDRVNLRLIARKIDSLSNDDITGICEDLGYNHILTSERRIIEEYLCSETEGFLHLLSTGVYPFDQSHFETGEVIDIKTLKKT